MPPVNRLRITGGRVGVFGSLYTQCKPQGYEVCLPILSNRGDDASCRQHRDGVVHEAINSITTSRNPESPMDPFRVIEQSVQPLYELAGTRRPAQASLGLFIPAAFP